MLFLALHDSPTNSTAQQLTDWLQEDPDRVRALDEALTLWALTYVARPHGRGRLS